MFRVYNPVATSNNINPYLAICEIFNISKSKLASLAGVSSQTLNSWINKSSYPSGFQLKLLRQYLGISIDCLLDGQVVLMEDVDHIPWHMPMVPSAAVMKYYRIHKGISICDFAKIVKLPLADILKYETGYLIPYDDALLISEACNIPMELLYGYTDFDKGSAQNRKKALIAIALQYSSDAAVITNLLKEMLTERDDK